VTGSADRKARFHACDLTVCETSRSSGLRLTAGAVSETACEGSVIRSPAFLPPGYCLPGLRSLRGRLRQPRTDNRPGRGMVQGRLPQTTRAPIRRRGRCRTGRTIAPPAWPFRNRYVQLTLRLCNVFLLSSVAATYQTRSGPVRISKTRYYWVVCWPTAISVVTIFQRQPNCRSGLPNIVTFPMLLQYTSYC
jgi:hypothetical protein